MPTSREILLESFTVDKHGIIRTTGPFFLERVFIPYFWSRAKAGDFDKIYIDIRNDRWFEFEVKDSDRKEYPELKTLAIVRVRQQNRSIVSWLSTNQAIPDNLHQDW